MRNAPDLLLPLAILPHTMETLDREFTVHRLWQAEDKDALIARIAPTTRFIAAGGHAGVDGALMDRLPQLEIIGNFGVGYDTIDAKGAATRGIVVTNTPDVLNEEVADTAMGLLLATARELPQAERYLRAGHWPSGNYPLTRGTLRGRTLGIAGLGRIGKVIARRAEAFGLQIAYTGRSPQAGVAYRYYASIVDLARAVDTLMLILPGGSETKNLVNAEVLA